MHVNIQFLSIWSANKHQNWVMVAGDYVQCVTNRFAALLLFGCLINGLLFSLSAQAKSKIVHNAAILLLLDEATSAANNGVIQLRSGILQGDTAVFNNVDQAGLNVSIQTLADIRVFDQGVLISGFEPSQARVLIRFSRSVALQDITLSAAADSPTFEIFDFSRVLQSFSQPDSNRWRAEPNGLFQVDTVLGPASPAIFTFNANLSELTFEYTGSPGSEFTIPGLTLQP